jgi:hypothetical protein
MPSDPVDESFNGHRPATVSLMIGALTTSRAVKDPELSADILQSAQSPFRIRRNGARPRDAATAGVDRLGMAHLPGGRTHLALASQSLKEQLADAFKAAIANTKLFEMRDRLEEILR